MRQQLSSFMKRVSNLNSYIVRQATSLSARSPHSGLANHDPLRDSAHQRGAILGPGFVLVVTFLFSMAWGVLVAFGAEEAPPSRVTGTLGAARPASSNPSFTPVRLVYRQTEGERFKRPTGVFVDRETGDILVADSANNLISLLNRDGVPIHSVGYNGEIAQPLMAVTDSHGRILVLAGVPQKVKVFSYRGEFQGDFTFPGYAGAAQAIPASMTVDRAGNLYICDGTTGRILVYDPEWRLLLSFGSRAEGPGAFTNVTAITVDSTGMIYVADAQHKPAIQVFDAGGAYIRGWGEHSAGPHNFSLPSGIAIDGAGRVLVADRIRQVVSVFTSEGQYLFRFGGLGTAPGALGYPSGLDTDDTGRLYVAEAVNARLQVFESTGTGSGSGDAPTRRSAPALPPRERGEINKGLGEVLMRGVK